MWHPTLRGREHRDRFQLLIRAWARPRLSSGQLRSRHGGAGTARPLRSPTAAGPAWAPSAAAIEQLHTQTPRPARPRSRRRPLSGAAASRSAPTPPAAPHFTPRQQPGVPQASRAGLPCPPPPAPAAARPGLPAGPLRADTALHRARSHRASPVRATLTCRAPGATDTVWDPPGNDTQRTASAANRSAPGAGRALLPANQRPRCPPVGGAWRDAAGAAKGGRCCPPRRAPRGFVYIGDLARAAARRGRPRARGAGRGGRGRRGRIGGRARAL